MSIPKVIHYCWFGHNPMPDSMVNCLNSWKKFCPDYEIKRWDEDNFDVNQCEFCKQAYERKKYAFVTDYARLKIVYEEGGIYLDTDVELIKPLDSLLDNTLYLGAEGKMAVNTGEGFGAVPHHPVVKANMEIYENMEFVNTNGEIVARNCPYYTTTICAENGILFPIDTIRKTQSLTVYPNDYFNPYDYKQNKTNITENTFSIHHYAATWMSAEQKRALVINSKLDRIEQKYGNMIRRIAEYYAWNCKKNGGSGVFHAVMNRIRH